MKGLAEQILKQTVDSCTLQAYPSDDELVEVPDWHCTADFRNCARRGEILKILRPTDDVVGILQIPADLIVVVLEQLPFDSLLMARVVCRRMHSMSACVG